MRAHPLSPIVAAAAALLLSACSGADSADPAGSADSGGSASASDSPAGVASALERISVDARGEGLYVEYGNTAMLTELAVEDPDTWQSLIVYGLSALAPVANGETVLGMDLSAADYALSVGLPPARLMLLSGGQDGEAVTEAAEQLGYSGDPVLSQEMDVTVKETITVHSLVTLGEDVALAGPEAEVQWADSDGESMMDDESVAALAPCLGDPAAAQILDVDGTDVGTAINSDGTETESVLCVAGDQDRAEAIIEEIESGTTLNGVPHSDYFTAAAAEVSDGMVRVVLQNAPDLPPNRIFALAEQRDLPLG